MSVPDLQQVPRDVFARGGYTLTTKEGAGQFTDAVAKALYAVDQNFGHLLKPEGRTHVVGPDGKRHAVDVVLYRTSGAIVDLIRDAGGPDATLSWGVGPDHEYGEADWYAPTGASGPTPEPIPPVQPPVVSLEPVLERLTALSAKVQAVNEALDRLAAKPDPVVTVPPITFPEYEGRLFGVSIVLRPRK